MASSTEPSRRFRARQARLEVEHEAGKLVADFGAWLKFQHKAEQTWKHYGWRVQRLARLLGANGVSLPPKEKGYVRVDRRLKGDEEARLVSLVLVTAVRGAL